MSAETVETLAVIPARSGSKRVVGKNVREFAGKPLIAWSIEAAKKAGIFSRIVVSTDSEDIAALAGASGAEIPFLRPPELADDYCPVGEVVKHAIQFEEEQGRFIDYACCIFATAPMVNPLDIQRGLQSLKQDPGFRSALAVTPFEFPIQRALRLNVEEGLEMIHPEHRLTRSQDLEECYHDAGQFFWVNNHFDEGQPDKGIKPVFVDRLRVQDIDTPADWRVAEYQFRLLELMQEQGDTHGVF